MVSIMFTIETHNSQTNKQTAKNVTVSRSKKMMSLAISRQPEAGNWFVDWLSPHSMNHTPRL
jgi:hypothetical protein